MDCHYIDIETLAGQPSEAILCYNILKMSYIHFMKTHTVLAAHSSHFPLIDEHIFTVFIKKIGVTTQ